MNRLDVYVLVPLVLLALFIWLRDTSWMGSSDDTLPILIGIPLFYWVGKPWNLSRPATHLSTWPVCLVALLFLSGIVANSTLLLAIGWVTLLGHWLLLRTPLVDHSRIRKLLVLPLMSFPWITLDAQPLGWWFRLSGAKATGMFYSLLGFNVRIEGTNLLIDGLPISVEAACSGLSALQSMLIAGSLLAYLYLGNSNRYWWNLPLLIAMAWLANTVRVAVISGIALAAGPEFAMGAIHTWGGWLVLVVMFLLCWGLFRLQEPAVEKES